MNRLFHFKQYLVPIALVGIIIGVWFYILLAPIVTQEGGVIYYLKPGTSRQAMVTELTEQGILTHPLALSIFITPQKSPHLKTGEYLFPKGASPLSMWRQMTTGKGLYYRLFTIVPGWSFTQLRRQLLLNKYLKHISQTYDDKQIMTELGNSSLAPEGEFYPDTYYYTRGVPDLVILKRAYQLMQLKLNEAWETRLPGLPYKDAYDALIVASLIEKEAYLNSERPVIAGVLINRLRKNMLLQIDPTVIYGMGDRYTGKIYKENLVENTPYNTYVHKGLPPTPIAMPSQASIEAAIHPQANDYYYFVAKGDGSHQFSKTLLDHNVAVQEAVKQRNS